jgi:Ca2+-binding EF-hand superfamily protein
MAEELTQDKIALYREAFDQVDRDKDGFLTIKEIAATIKNFGDPPKEKDIKDMVAEVDIDGNGSIEFKEFITLLARKMRDADTFKDDLQEIFNMFDTKKDEIIDFDELKNVMISIGEVVTDEDINDMIAEAGGDTTLTFENFYDKVTSYTNK